MKLTSIACLMILAAYLPAQTSHPAVVVVEKNAKELQKVRGVAVVNGADGQHPAPEVDVSASAAFADAISKQLEQLTCWKLLPRTSPMKTRGSERPTTLMTYVEDTAIPDEARRTVTYGAVFQFSVVSNDGTLWDGSKRVGPAQGKQGFYTTVQIQSVVADMLGALAEDACPGAKQLLQASFDCGKAVTRTEKLICGSPELSNADGVMAAGYKKVMTEARAILPAAAEELKRDQLQWIEENATCEDATCLQKRYGERIAFLYAYGRVTAAGGAANDEATAAFLRRYPWWFRLVPRLMKEVRGLLGSEYEAFYDAMEHVYDSPTGSSDIWGSPMHPMDLRCFLEAFLSVTAGGRVAVGVADSGRANVISVFSEPKASRLEELPRVKGWVEEFQKRCGERGDKWTVKLR